MTAATTRREFDWQRLRLKTPALLRLLGAGVAWGITLSVGLAGLTMWNDGMICLDDIVATTVISVLSGVFTIGPIAAYGGR
jgi:hypothetical protein